MHTLILLSDTTLPEAVSLLDKNGNGFLPVVDASGVLLGIITDGDLRKGLLKNLSSVHDIINRAPITASIHEPRKSVIRRLHELKRWHMPIIDDAGKFVDVVILNDFAKRQYPNFVVVMAGGLGTRLGELTKHTPKPMLLVNGQPILKHIIDNLMNAGFTKFIFCLNHKAEIIRDYFKDGKQWGVEINYTIEGKRLGTAGALSLLDQKLIEHPFLVTNADIITSLSYENLLDFHGQMKSVATMCVKQYTVQLPYANVVIDEHENLLDLEEKPSVPFYINAGIYVLDPSVLQLIPHNEYLDMPSLFQTVKRENHLVKVFKMDEDWVDVGLPQDYYSFKNGE